MYQMISTTLVVIGCLAFALMIIGSVLMVVAAIPNVREEWALRKGGHTQQHMNAINSMGRHRLETAIEKAKRELREEKERQAREDSFFDHYYMFGDITGLDHPAYNLRTTEVYTYQRLMDELNDDSVMKVASEGL